MANKLLKLNLRSLLMLSEKKTATDNGIININYTDKTNICCMKNRRKTEEKVIQKSNEITLICKHQR